MRLNYCWLKVVKLEVFLKRLIIERNQGYALFYFDPFTLLNSKNDDQFNHT